MPTPKALPPIRGSLVHRASEERPLPGGLSPEARRLARTAGGALAAGALLTAFVASAQTAAYGPSVESNGILPWVFALFVAAAVIGVFLVVLALFRAPTHREGEELPGAARRR